MPPTVIRMPQYSSGAAAGRGGGGHFNEPRNRGFRVGCCRVCTCVNLEFFMSKNGILKIFEIILGSFCQTLLIQFGMDCAKDIGEAFHGFLTTVSACLTTTSILLLCYAISARTFHLVRQSIFVSVASVYGRGGGEWLRCQGVRGVVLMFTSDTVNTGIQLFA